MRTKLTAEACVVVEMMDGVSRVQSVRPEGLQGPNKVLHDSNLYSWEKVDDDDKQDQKVQRQRSQSEKEDEEEELEMHNVAEVLQMFGIH